MLKNFEQEKFDIIIQAGQSNSEGTGFGPAIEPYLPNDNVWYLNGDFTISSACELVTGNKIQSNYSLSFANEYIKNGCLKQGRKVLILRSSVGGTGFLDNRWGLKDDLFLRMIDMIKTALSLNKDNKLVAFLWHQGEADAILNASYQSHYNNLFNLVSVVRQTFECSKLPFIAGDFVHEWKNANIDICKPVIESIQDVCINCKFSRFIETEGLSPNDPENDSCFVIHFSRQAQYELGKRYYKAFTEILDEL